MNNYLSELRTFLQIISDEANGFVDHDCAITVGKHKIELEMSAELFDDIEMVIVEEIKRSGINEF